MSPERWLSLMHALGVGSNLDTYERLLVAYSEPHRHYHTADHISACLRQLDGARDLATFPAEVEVALWFHDAIYSPAAFDNESRSAEWAAQFLSSVGISREACQRVHQHIMATWHEAQPADSNSALVVDIAYLFSAKTPLPTRSSRKTYARSTAGYRGSCTGASVARFCSPSWTATTSMLCHISETATSRLPVRTFGLQ
jgi:predicted metal-dependent HD superfamily phosphohydrolase